MTNIKAKTKTVAKPHDGAKAAPSQDVFAVLIEDSEKFCEAVGLNKNLISLIIQIDNDWAFILKVDALLETAAKEILRKHLNFKLASRTANVDAMEKFIDALPLLGRTSVLELLKAAGCPKVDINFISAARLVRNAYAHNVRNLDVPMMELIKQRNDRINLMKHMSAMNDPTEAEVIAMHKKDASFPRFGIITSTMRFLLFAYHVAIK